MDDPILHDEARDLWVVPVRHHSPACAAHLERLITAVQPAAVLVEGPCDFDPLIDAQDYQLSDLNVTTDSVVENSHAIVTA